jgi:hypothetical protein
MAAFETFFAYLSQLSGNPSVQADLERSVRSARAAYRQSLYAARSALESIRRGPEIERRRRRRRPVLIAGAAIAAATAIALYPDLRTQLSRPSSAEPA